jgi:hypothetical protein
MLFFLAKIMNIIYLLKTKNSGQKNIESSTAIRTLFGANISVVHSGFSFNIRAFTRKI